MRVSVYVVQGIPDNVYDPPAEGGGAPPPASAPPPGSAPPTGSVPQGGDASQPPPVPLQRPTQEQEQPTPPPAAGSPPRQLQPDPAPPPPSQGQQGGEEGVAGENLPQSCIVLQ